MYTKEKTKIVLKYKFYFLQYTPLTPPPSPPVKLLVWLCVSQTKPAGQSYSSETWEAVCRILSCKMVWIRQQEHDREEAPISKLHQRVAHWPEVQQTPVELLQSPHRGEAGEGCPKRWIVTLPWSLSTAVSPGVVFKLSGVVIYSDL